MAAKIQKKEIIEYSVAIKLDNREQPVYVWVNRNLSHGAWRVHLPDKEKFLIKELIDICTTIYDAGIFEDADTYILECESWQDYYYIRGKEKVVDCILEQIKVPFVKKEES